jgi:hypothetical protein
MKKPITHQGIADGRRASATKVANSYGSQSLRLAFLSLSGEPKCNGFSTGHVKGAQSSRLPTDAFAQTSPKFVGGVFRPKGLND